MLPLQYCRNTVARLIRETFTRINVRSSNREVQMNEQITTRCALYLWAGFPCRHPLDNPMAS